MTAGLPRRRLLDIAVVASLVLQHLPGLQCAVAMKEPARRASVHTLHDDHGRLTEAEYETEHITPGGLPGVVCRAVAVHTRISSSGRHEGP